LFKPGEDLHATRYYIQYPTADGPASRLEELRRNPRFFQERWWDDGKILAGGREYSALLTTGCYQRGEISCLSCHSMHNSDPNDQLKRFPSESAQCTQCHQEDQYTSDVTKHTFHGAESSGSQCLNCHMPHTTYALFKGIRSHQIGSPSLEGALAGGAPNACNVCHLDQTLGWTQEHLVEWYGAKPVELSEEELTVSASLTWLLRGHAAYRVIAAWHFGWAPAQEVSGGGWMAPQLARLLDDPYGVVRYVAARSLRTLPGYEAFEYDFLAAPSGLAERSQAAVQQWNNGRSHGGENRRVLIGAEGAVMEEAVADQLRRRDNRSVTIQE
jgi:predicted CXXCH cytochrome family protein